MNSFSFSLSLSRFLRSTMAAAFVLGRLQCSAQDSTGQTDLVDVLGRLKKKPATMGNNKRMQPGHVHWSLVPGAGYTMGNGFTGSLTGNASFYVTNAGNQNISSITSVATFTAQKQFSFVLQPSIWLRGNRKFLVGDYRFLINPQLNFGLGGNTKIAQSDVIDYRLLRVYQYVFFRARGDWFVGPGVHYNHYHRINTIEQNGKPTADCRRYGLGRETTSAGASVNVLWDQRRNLNNPVAGGRYLLVQWLQFAKGLGSSANWRNLVVDTRHYVGLNKKGNRKLALWGYGSFSFGKAPYLELPNTACDANNNMGRGYVAGRFRGRHLLYGEAELRTPLTRNGLLGGVLFTNVQSVTDWPTNAFTKLHPAVGGGLRLKFNKHANTNICVDYGIGLDGSKGIFVNLGEVF